jgi:hypothetical protein
MGYYEVTDCLTVTVGASIISLVLLLITLKIRRSCCKGTLTSSIGFLIALIWVILLFAGCMTTWYLVHKQLYFPVLGEAWALGMVDHNSAKVWVHSLGDKEVKVTLGHQGINQSSALYKLSKYNNWTTTILIQDLKPSTVYTYKVVSDGIPLKADFSGTLITSPLPYTTGHSARFNFGSCLMPVPWTNMQIFDFWGKQNLDLAMLIGDAVYLDTFGVIPAAQAYPQILADPVYAKFFQNIPNYFMYDDHEIINDYDQGRHSDLFNETMHYWIHYYGQKNPSKGDSVDHDALYYNFTRGDVGFFIMDTRMYRSPKLQPDDEEKTMLGSEQKKALKEWLLQPGLTFKFLISPVPYTVRLDLIDGWQGYITEREEILDFIEDNEIAGCVLLSADSHFSAINVLRPWAIEYSASPLYAIPLVQSAYFHPEELPILHPVKGNVIPDHQIWSNDISKGTGFSYGTVEVNTEGPEPWYEVSIMGFNGFGIFGASADIKVKHFLNETRPTKKRSNECKL